MSKAGLAKRQIFTDDIPLDIDALKAVMPTKQKHNITQSLVDELNLLVTEPNERETFRENIMGFVTVLNDPNIALAHYVQAVKYVSYKMMGDSNQEAWIKTFPDRYKRLIDAGRDAGHIRSTVGCYNRNKVVAAVTELSLIPSWIINQDIYQRAVNVQAMLMTSAKSETVRQNAADSLMTHLKMPEAAKMTLDINVEEDDSLRQLREVTTDLVRQQKKMLEEGLVNAKEVAESKIIPGKFKRLDE